MKANRLVLLAVAGATTLSLTGCSQTGNTAAEVDGDVVTTSDVDLLTRVQCGIIGDAAEAQPGQVPTTPRRVIRTQMLNVLIQTELDDQLGAQEDVNYDGEIYRQAMDQFAADIAKAPAEDRERFRELVSDSYKATLKVVELARRQLVAQGTTEPTNEQVQGAMQAIQAEFRKSADIEIDPVYGAKDGVAGAEDPSLSVAVSSFAKKSSEREPAASWVSGLPTRQRCG